MFRKNKLFLLAFFLLFLLVVLSFTGCLSLPSGSLYITSNPSGATIYLNGNDSGKVTPSFISSLAPGPYLLGLTLGNPPVNREESVTVFENQTTSLHFELIPQTQYRALCVGINEYQDPGILDLRAPSFDVDRIIRVFENSSFDQAQIPFSSIDTLIGQQATGSAILQSIGSLSSTANNQDVFYFYFSGHGWTDGNTATILPYDALGENTSQDISVDELAFALGSIPGTKVVILDSCHSGKFIGKGEFKREEADDNHLVKFNENVLQSFTLHETILEKGNLASGEFKVIVSASGDQSCLETLNHPIDGNPYGYFSASLCEGCGYDHFTFPVPADSNADSKVTLKEIVQYVGSSLFYLEQNVQVYPENSSFIFIEY